MAELSVENPVPLMLRLLQVALAPQAAGLTADGSDETLEAAVELSSAGCRMRASVKIEFIGEGGE